MNTELINRATLRFMRAFQEIHHLLLELCKARWDVSFPVLLTQAAKENGVVAAHASELANLHPLRKHIAIFWGTRSAIPSDAAVARLERIRESLRRTQRRAMAGTPKIESPHSQGSAPEESASGGISGTDAAVQVLMNLNNKEISIVELTAAAMKEGWSSKGKYPKQTLSATLRNEIKRRGSRARFAKGSRPGTWKLSTAGVQYANEQAHLALVYSHPDAYVLRPVLTETEIQCPLALKRLEKIIIDSKTNKALVPAVIGHAVSALLANPDELEVLADKLGLAEDDILTPEQIWEYANNVDEPNIADEEGQIESDLINLEVQMEYQRLLDSPDELEALADRLEIPEDGTLTPEDIWAEAYRLLYPDPSMDDRD